MKRSLLTNHPPASSVRDLLESLFVTEPTRPVYDPTNQWIKFGHFEEPGSWSSWSSRSFQKMIEARAFRSEIPSLGISHVSPVHMVTIHQCERNICDWRTGAGSQLIEVTHTKCHQPMSILFALANFCSLRTFRNS